MLTDFIYIKSLKDRNVLTSVVDALYKTDKFPSDHRRYGVITFPQDGIKVDTFNNNPSLVKKFLNGKHNPKINEMCLFSIMKNSSDDMGTNEPLLQSVTLSDADYNYVMLGWWNIKNIPYVNNIQNNLSLEYHSGKGAKLENKVFPMDFAMMLEGFQRGTFSEGYAELMAIAINKETHKADYIYVGSNGSMLYTQRDTKFFKSILSMVNPKVYGFKNGLGGNILRLDRRTNNVGVCDFKMPKREVGVVRIGDSPNPDNNVAIIPIVGTVDSSTEKVAWLTNNEEPESIIIKFPSLKITT